MPEHTLIATSCQSLCRQSWGCFKRRTSIKHILIATNCQCRGWQLGSCFEVCTTQKHIDIAGRGQSIGRQNRSCFKVCTSPKHRTITVIFQCFSRQCWRCFKISAVLEHTVIAISCQSLGRQRWGIHKIITPCEHSIITILCQYRGWQIRSSGQCVAILKQITEAGLVGWYSRIVSIIQQRANITCTCHFHIVLGKGDGRIVHHVFCRTIEVCTTQAERTVGTSEIDSFTCHNFIPFPSIQRILKARDGVTSFDSHHECLCSCCRKGKVWTVI